MKLNLRLTENNIGDIIYVETEDKFSIDGEIITISESSIEVKDINSHNLFTIFLFEIKELIITKSKNNEQNISEIQVPRKAIGPGAFLKVKLDSEKLHLNQYDHPTFGKLSRNENVLNFSKLSGPKSDSGANEVQYIVVNTPDSIYKECVSYLQNSNIIGMSFYDSCEQSSYRYVVLSCSSFTLLVDLLTLDADQIIENYSELVALMMNEKQLKLAYGCRNLFFFIYTHFRVQLTNLIDLQIMHYGLHNIRVTEALREPLSYLDMVELLFNVTFKIKGKAYFTNDDAINKLAFNSHFLIPMYEFMLNRLLDPVKIISNRVCHMNNEELANGTIITDLNLAPCSYDFSILPRALQFWTYRDTSSMLQAKKITDTELHTEKRDLNKNRSDVVEINKGIAEKQEKEEKIGMTYYEALSESEDEEVEAFKEATVLWRQEQPGNIRPNEVIDGATRGVSMALGIGRGRGLGLGLGRQMKGSLPGLKEGNKVLNDFDCFQKESETMATSCQGEKGYEECVEGDEGMSHQDAINRGTHGLGRGVYPSQTNTRRYPGGVNASDRSDSLESSVIISRDCHTRSPNESSRDEGQDKGIPSNMQSDRLVAEDSVVSVSSRVDESREDSVDLADVSDNCDSLSQIIDHPLEVHSHRNHLRRVDTINEGMQSIGRGRSQRKAPSSVSANRNASFTRPSIIRPCHSYDAATNSVSDGALADGSVDNGEDDSHYNCRMTNDPINECPDDRIRGIGRGRGQRSGLCDGSDSGGDGRKVRGSDDRQEEEDGPSEERHRNASDSPVGGINGSMTHQDMIDYKDADRNHLRRAQRRTTVDHQEEEGGVGRGSSLRGSRDRREGVGALVRLSSRNSGVDTDREDGYWMGQSDGTVDTDSMGGRIPGLGRGLCPLKNTRPSLNGHDDSMGANDIRGSRQPSVATTSSIENIDSQWMTHQAKDEVADFCELPQFSWNKTRVGKLSLDKYDEQLVHTTNRSEAQGIIWNEISIKGEKITDDLYAEFGLS